jgi:hypothetical protein
LIDFHNTSARSLIPGDEVALRSMGGSFEEVSQRVGDLSRRLQAIRSGGLAHIWVGRPAQVFSEYIVSLPDDLARISDSYGCAGEALMNLAIQVVGARLDLEPLLSSARQRQDRDHAVCSQLAALERSGCADSDQLIQLENEHNNLRGQLRYYEAQVEECRGMLAFQCGDTVRRLREAAGLGLENRNWGQRLRDNAVGFADGLWDNAVGFADALVEAHEELAPYLLVVGLAAVVLLSGGTAAPLVSAGLVSTGMATFATGTMGVISGSYVAARWIGVFDNPDGLSLELVLETILVLTPLGLKGTNRIVPGTFRESYITGIEVLVEVPGVTEQVVFRPLANLLTDDQRASLRHPGGCDPDHVNVYAKRCRVEEAPVGGGGGGVWRPAK